MVTKIELIEVPIRLERVFTHIANTRMLDVPILNPALRVAAVGFRLWQGYWVGVLLTPWTINLVLMPDAQGKLEALQLGQRRAWSFPSGVYDFMGLNEAELGVCHICPLISPVTEFATQEEALALAREIAEALFTETQPGNNAESLPKEDLSRRAFLRLPFARS
jgi:[NiFe] hydrogenase assembly HybE family chaperone